MPPFSYLVLEENLLKIGLKNKSLLSNILLHLCLSTMQEFNCKYHVVRCIIMRTKVEAPVSKRIQDLPKSFSSLIDSLLIWNTQVSFFTNSNSNTRHFYFHPMLRLSPVNLLLFLTLSLCLSLYSSYSPLCFHLLLFNINTPTIFYALSLNKLD